MKIAVLGCSPLAIGPVSAADLAGSGHDVALAPLGRDDAARLAVGGPGGLRIGAGPAATLSGHDGAVDVRMVATPGEAMAGAELVLVDVPAAAVEDAAGAMAPHLDGVRHVHFQTHGYWPSLRAARVWGAVRLNDFALSEGTAPSHAGALHDGGRVEIHVVRRNIALGVFPANRTEAAAARLARVLPLFRPARDVLETNLESMNFLVHPAIALLNWASFERAADADHAIDFYGRGNTADAGRLAEALDAERHAPMQALGLHPRRLADQIAALYGGPANPPGVRAAIAAAPFYRTLPPLPATAPMGWMRADVPFAHVPFVHLSEALGTPASLHRALATICGAMMNADFWTEGLTLANVGLDGLSAKEAMRFARTGIAA